MAKAATPPLAVAVVVPCRVLVPAPRVAVTTVLLSLLRKLPNWSSMRMTGWVAKTTPAAAVADGCVWIVRRLATPALTELKDNFGNVHRIGVLGISRSLAPDDLKYEPVGPIRALTLGVQKVANEKKRRGLYP